MTCAICQYYDICIWHNENTDYCIELRETRSTNEK